MASNGNDGEIVRHFEEGGAAGPEAAPVANRVRSASESSVVRHLFSQRKRSVAAALEAGENGANGEEGDKSASNGQIGNYEKI